VGAAAPRGGGEVQQVPCAAAAGAVGFCAMAGRAGCDRRSQLFCCCTRGFFTCGFHIAFLVTHFAGRSESLRFCRRQWRVWSLALIGLANIAGSLIAGWCTQRFRSKYILATMYGSRRRLLIGWYLLEPRTKWTFYAFAVGLGLTWLATVPPHRHHRRQALRYPVLVHAVRPHNCSHTRFGGFSWRLSRRSSRLVRFGDYQWMWYARYGGWRLPAAVINLPIREG